LRFKRHINIEPGLQPIIFVPFINVIFLLVIFYILSSSFTLPSGIKVKLPRAITSDVVKEENLTITITSENIIYLDGIISTIEEIKKNLNKASNKTRPVLIKADRRASLGRVIDIWDLCREIGIERVNIATDQKN